MLRHRAVAVAVLAVLLIAPCAGVCVGWETSAHAGMACCADKSQDDADACCALGESRRNADLFAGLVPTAQSLPAVDAGQLASTLAAPRLFAPRWDSHDRILSDTDRHVLFSVFLI